MFIEECTVGKDPELKWSASGVCYTKFTVAFTPPKKGVPIRERETQWFNVTVFNGKFDSKAENVAQSISKGDKVLVVGNLGVDGWVDKNSGEKKQGLSIIADHVLPTLTFQTVQVDKVQCVEPKRDFEDEEPF